MEIGPESGDHFWVSPLRRFRDSVRPVKRMGVAWPTAAFYYTNYTFSRLMYKLQLQLPTTEVRFEECRAHARVLSIPRQSIPPKLAQRLKALGLPQQLPEADMISKASMYRVYATSTRLADLRN